jgi:hypothetical protein
MPARRPDGAASHIAALVLPDQKSGFSATGIL